MNLYNLAVGEDKVRSNIYKGRIFTTKGEFVDPSEYDSSIMGPIGYALTDKLVVSIRRSVMGYLYSEAKEFIRSLGANIGRKCRIPTKEELKLIYHDVRYGRMKYDLTTAGIYGVCNYRLNTGSEGWNKIWMNSDPPSVLGIDGELPPLDGCYSLSYIIAVFDI